MALRTARSVACMVLLPHPLVFSTAGADAWRPAFLPNQEVSIQFVPYLRSEAGPSAAIRYSRFTLGGVIYVAPAVRRAQ